MYVTKCIYTNVCIHSFMIKHIHVYVSTYVHSEVKLVV
jgi:hypothetical protein